MKIPNFEVTFCSGSYHVLPPCSLTLCPCLPPKALKVILSFFGWRFGPIFKWICCQFYCESSFKKKPVRSTLCDLSSNQIIDLEVLKQQEQRHQQIREELGEVVPRSQNWDRRFGKKIHQLSWWNLRVPHPMPFKEGLLRPYFPRH